ISQQVIQCDHLGNHCNVFSGVQENCYQWQLDTENRRGLGVEPRAIDACSLTPLLEAYHNFHPLLLSHCADSKNRWHIDEADSADLHVMPLQLVPPANEHVVAAPFCEHEIIGNQPVPALDEIEHALGFSDAASAREEKTHAEHVGKRAVKSC